METVLGILLVVGVHIVGAAVIGFGIVGAAVLAARLPRARKAEVAWLRRRQARPKL